MTRNTLPRAATFRLPTADQPSLEVGCGRCEARVQFALSHSGMDDGRRFLREHAGCLADPRC